MRSRTRLPWALAGILSLLPTLALADSIMEPGEKRAPTYAPIGVIQMTPGLHLSFSGGHFGGGASLDVLGGVVLNGNREFAISPGLVVGPFAEVNAAFGRGVTTTLGGRGGVGGLAPTLGGGFIPWGMLTYDQGRTAGAQTGTRRGVHARVIYGDLGISHVADDAWVVALGPAQPLLPVPWVE